VSATVEPVESTPKPAAAAALEVSGLTTGYGHTTVLRDVSLTVPAGAVTALLGPNGAGKSTFLRAVSGFLPATTGTVKLGGDDITKVRADRRFAAGLCHVPEGRGVFRGLTVRENIVMQSVKGEEAQAIDRAADAFRVLGERLHQRAGTLSGGQQQMLAMAVAYVRNPSLVLVDEASLGLAPIIVDDIFAFLERRTLEGASLLIVDQFVHRALQMSTTAYVMNRGTIAFEGSASELLNSNLFEQDLGQGTG
jgi:branched-chain amino acid transport system ATP-binding protein